MKDKLTIRERSAINYYLKGFTQKEAMVKAGYSREWAEARPGDIFSKPRVRKEIERRQKLAEKRTDVDLDWIVERLRLIADSNLVDLYDIYSDGSAELNLSKLEKFPHLASFISGLETETYMEGRGPQAKKVKRVKVRTADKLRALELLVRHLGLSKEKVKIEGEVDLVSAINQGLTRAGKNNNESD